MSQNSRNQGFSYYICLMIEGSGSRAGSGSIPLTNGSGWPKNTWIRIRNTEKSHFDWTKPFQKSESRRKWFFGLLIKINKKTYRVYRLHTAILNRPLSSAATKEV